MSSNGNPNTHNGHTVPTTPEVKPLLPEAKQYNLRGGIPNSPLSVSVISAILGGLAGSCLAFASIPLFKEVSWNWARPQLGVYLACMGLFHLCEFWTTAGWNAQKLSVDGERSCSSTQAELLMIQPSCSIMVLRIGTPTQSDSQSTSYPHTTGLQNTIISILPSPSHSLVCLYLPAAT